MLIRAIRRFREKTEQEYKRLEQEGMEQWKKDVMHLHERAEFLFYYEEADTVQGSLLQFQLTGELVKGRREAGDRLYLYSGRGEWLAEAEYIREEEEEEERHLGVLHRKQNRFVIKIRSLCGEEVGTMEVGLYRKKVSEMFSSLSLLADCPPVQSRSGAS
ncbi:MAG: hypothetical protein Q4D60_04945 [Eubacteriales bacterium]|nr:hypothetical protein [Eubacteriales bacterium]